MNLNLPKLNFLAADPPILRVCKFVTGLVLVRLEHVSTWLWSAPWGRRTRALRSYDNSCLTE
jgi:hypothetical protein